MTARTAGARRHLWPTASAAGLALALALAGCSGSTSDDDAGSTSTSTSTSGSSSTATAGSGDVVALAEAFSATLDEDQQEALEQEYTFENAANWSNLPNSLLGGGGGPGGGGGSTSSGRVGLQTDSLTDEQWAALDALLDGVTGSAPDEGYDEVVQHLAADDYLADNGGGDAYGRGQFFVAFLGTPSDSGTWGLQFGGHHLAIANTYVDGQLAGATPSFRGIEPFETVEVDGTTVQPEQQEAAAFNALLESLDDDQLATAELSSSYNDLLLGPGEDWAFPETAEGIPGSELTDEQRDLLLAAVQTYVGDIDDENAAAVLATYESQLDDTYVSWAGSTAMTEIGDYVRVDGPQVWIEFSQQNGVVLDGAHPHAVWRDKVTDYAGTTS
ncbi:DUF3500 domain-containing protein [Pseudokineococcus sp. 1T1Z-3]|uniref:DUF3500 domain-containing protein n=1 Tax=Pseudokineococcus sp. 1T1Z-3 TaxID=3132745 RepID=UPI0030AF97D3